MDTFDIPIFKNAYELYRELYGHLKQFPKSDRYALGQRCELTLGEVLELLFEASGLPKTEKLPYLDRASTKLNMFRVRLRLAKDVRALDQKAYLALQGMTDEIGRMLGGWRRSLETRETSR